jgi:hypothetical protein
MLGNRSYFADYALIFAVKYLVRYYCMVIITVNTYEKFN